MPLGSTGTWGATKGAGATVGAQMRGISGTPDMSTKEARWGAGPVFGATSNSARREMARSGGGGGGGRSGGGGGGQQGTSGRAGGGEGGTFEKIDDPTGQHEPGWVKFNTNDMGNWTEQQLRNFGATNFSMGQHKFKQNADVFEAYKKAMEKYL